MIFSARQMLKNTVWIIIFGLLMCGCMFAQQTQSLGIHRYQQQIQECNRIISTWQWQANTQIVFVISVTVFGALITILQGLKKGWCKPATLVLGAAITILTGINARMFSADYRVLEQSAIDGRDLVDQMDIIAENLGRPEADIAGLESQWVKTKTQFSGLQKAVLQGTTKTSGLNIWVKTVYAQSASPAWYMHPPSDDYNLYFRGVAEDRSLEAARRQSFDNAVALGVATLSGNKGTDGDKLRKVIASSADIDKFYFELDKGKGVYRYYTLLRISNDIKNLSFKNATAEISGSIVGESGPTRWMDLGPRELLRIANQNHRVDPRVSLNLIFYAMTITHSIHSPVTIEERTALQALLWERGWVPTYRASGKNMDINAVDISSDGKFLATAHDNGTVQIWSISSGQPLYELQSCQGSVKDIDFSHNGTTVATGCLDGNIRLWNAANGKDLGFHIHTIRKLDHVIFNPDDSRLLTQEEGSRVSVWSVRTSALLYTLAMFPDEAVRSISYAPNGTLLATGLTDGKIILWDAAGTRKASLPDFNDAVVNLVFSSDGRQLIATSENGHSEMIDIITHRVTSKYSSHGKQVTMTSALIHQGRLLLMGSSPGEYKVWDSVSREDVLVLRGQDSWREHSGPSKDGMKLVFWNNNTVRMMPVKIENAISEAKKYAAALSPLECSKYLKVKECPEFSLP